MELRELNSWDVTPDQARAIQLEQSSRDIRDGIPTGVRLVAGIDVSVRDNINRAAIVVDEFPGLVIVQAVRTLESRPDLVIVNGQGIAYPRGLGIASHVGLLLDVPTIGCAKSILVGRHAPVGPAVGDWSPLEYKHEVIGAALRTRVNVTPVYVSIGHRIGLEPSIHWILACCRGFRLPEPQRQTHLAAGSA